MKISMLMIAFCVAVLVDIPVTLAGRADETKKEARQWKRILKQKHKNACVPGADVGIVLDTSKSIRIRHLKKIKQFLAHLVDRFEVSPSASRIGLIRFNRRAFFDFDFNEYTSNADVKAAIRAIDNKLGWQTRTDKGLRKAETGLFTAEGGDRPDRKNLLFVFTDGKPTGLTKPDFEHVKDVAARLENKNVTIVAVGYGRRTKEENVKDIAGEHGHHLLFSTIDEFLKQVDVIVSQTCVIPIDGQWTEWTQWGECSVTCGGGTRTRSRTCTNPEPEHGGKDCKGKGEESEECRTDPCEPPCDGAIDLGIIADISKSVRMENLPRLKDALKTIVDKFEVSEAGTHMGLITFAKVAEMRFSFADTEYQNVDAAKANIDEINKLFLQTRTDLALIKAHDELFTAAGGDRPNKPNVLIVFTDGRPTPKPGYKDFSVTIPPLEAKGVTITAVGIGKGIDEDVLKDISGQKGHVVMVDDFKKLDDQLERIKELACAGSK